MYYALHRSIFEKLTAANQLYDCLKEENVSSKVEMLLFLFVLFALCPVIASVIIVLVLIRQGLLFLA